MKQNKSSHFLNEITGIVPAASSLAQDNSNPKMKILKILRQYVEFESVADLGCGKCGWLSAAREMGASTVHGFDIPEIDISDREISSDEFTPADLSKVIDFERSYDLAVSTEVAEHIPEKLAGNFVTNLVTAAPIVLFSAATPYQGGVGHTNENWVEYWDRFFTDRGYVCFDYMRDLIWHDPGIPFYYRQNILMYAAADRVEDLVSKGLAVCPRPKTLIHPDMLIKAIHLTQKVNNKRHSILGDARSYYGSLVGSDDVFEGNQEFGDLSFK